MIGSLATTRPRYRSASLAVLSVGAVVLLCPTAASAAPMHATVVVAGADIFSTIGHALLGSFSWTFDLASKFLLTTFAALVRLLVPRSWVGEGVQIMGWIVAVPNYAGQVTSPGGAREYGFAGINDLRQLFTWLGIAIAPLTLTHATARSLVDESEPVAIPFLRIVAAAAAIVLYPYVWSQAADLADQVTHLILGVPQVTDGLRKLMEYAVGGVALGGWQLIDLGLMAAIAIALLGLIFMKVVLILIGALLYAVGPLMIGLVATRFGHAIARAWLSAAMFLLGIGIAWAAIFAVGAVLIDDATTAGPLIAGNSTFGDLIGGIILAVAGLVALWLCLKTAREAGGLLRLQLGGMLALGAGGLSVAGSRPSSASTPTTGASLRRFGSRLVAGTNAAGVELTDAMPGGRAVRGTASAARGLGRRGVLGSALVGVRGTARRAAGPGARILSRSRAGAVAVRAARSGTTAYRAAGTRARRPTGEPGRPPRRPDRRSPARPPRAGTGSGSRESISASASRGDQPAAAVGSRPRSVGATADPRVVDASRSSAPRASSARPAPDTGNGTDSRATPAAPPDATRRGRPAQPTPARGTPVPPGAAGSPRSSTAASPRPARVTSTRPPPTERRRLRPGPSEDDSSDGGQG